MGFTRDVRLWGCDGGKAATCMSPAGGYAAQCMGDAEAMWAPT